MHSDQIHPEQEMLLELLSPSVEAQQSRLRRKIEHADYPHNLERATRALRLIELFPMIHYTEYRSLIGGLNYIRCHGNESWESIISYFSDLLEYPLFFLS